jgi:DNA-binding MarR family transcriptional regulator
MPPLRLEEFLPYRLNVLAATVSESLATLYAERYGISIPEWRVIATLGQFERMTGRDIASHSRMHKTTVSRAAAALEAKGWIKRETNRADLREAFLTLKPKGRAVYDDLVPRATTFADGLLDGLDRQERAALDRLIGHLMQRARRGAADPVPETARGCRPRRSSTRC